MNLWKIAKSVADRLQNILVDTYILQPEFTWVQ